MAKAWKFPPSASPSDLFEDIRALIKRAQQLTWSHVVELLPLKDSLRRDFYALDVPTGELERTQPMVTKS